MLNERLNRRLTAETWTCQLKYENKAVKPRVKKFFTNENILNFTYTFRPYLIDQNYTTNLVRESMLAIVMKPKKSHSEVI